MDKTMNHELTKVIGLSLKHKTVRKWEKNMLSVGARACAL